MVGAYSFGDNLSQRRIVNEMCFFCSIEVENTMHQFVSCPIARMVWKVINVALISSIVVRRSPFNWVFASKWSGVEWCSTSKLFWITLCIWVYSGIAEWELPWFVIYEVFLSQSKLLFIRKTRSYGDSLTWVYVIWSCHSHRSMWFFSPNIRLGRGQ